MKIFKLIKYEFIWIKENGFKNIVWLINDGRQILIIVNTAKVAVEIY